MSETKKRKKQVFPASQNGDNIVSPALSRDIDVFLAINLKNTESVLAYIPLVEGKGQTKSVPKHFIGHDTSFGEVLWKIREFRNASLEEQNIEWKRWRSMKRREKDLYRTRISKLEELQESMRAERGGTNESCKKKRSSAGGSATTTNVNTNGTSTTSQSTSTFSQPSTSIATTATGCVAIIPALPSSTAGGSNAPTRNLRSQDAAEEEATTAPNEPTSAVAPIGDGLTQTVTSNSTTMSETGATAEPSEPLENETKPYVGLASSREKRKNAMPSPGPKSEHSRKITRPRNIGLPCQALSQQADATAMRAQLEALIATANAIDTTSFPGRQRHEPGHKMALMILNEVKETNPVGGGSNARSWRRSVPTFIVVTSSARDFKDITIAAKATLKHSNRTTKDHGYDTRVLIANEEESEPCVAPAVYAYVDQYKESRKNPPKKPRAFADIQAELAQDMNKENRPP